MIDLYSLVTLNTHSAQMQCKHTMRIWAVFFNDLWQLLLYLLVVKTVSTVACNLYYTLYFLLDAMTEN